MLKNRHIIKVQNSEEIIRFLLVNDKRFKCHLLGDSFSIVENLFFSNQFLHPVASGMLCHSKKGSTTVDVHIDLRFADKLFFLFHALISLVISVFSVMYTRSIDLSIAVVFFSIGCFMIFLLVYKYNCKRFYKRFVALLNSHKTSS